LVVTAERSEDMPLLKVMCGNVTFIIMTFNVKKKRLQDEGFVHHGIIYTDTVLI